MKKTSLNLNQIENRFFETDGDGENIQPQSNSSKESKKAIFELTERWMMGERPAWGGRNKSILQANREELINDIEKCDFIISEQIKLIVKLSSIAQKISKNEIVFNNNLLEEYPNLCEKDFEVKPPSIKNDRKQSP